MRKVRIAQIGLNQYSHSGEIFDTLVKFPELYGIAGYCLVEEERETCADKIKHFAGYPELTLEQVLNDPTIEAVAVETDEIHLTKYAQMAAEHGKHIHMEKPGGADLAAFEKLIETVKANGKVFHIGYMYRYNPFIREAIESVKRGDFGEVFSVEAHMSRYDPPKVREWFNTLPAGMMFYLGCHLVDLVLQIKGAPKRVIPMTFSSRKDGIVSPDYGFAMLEYDSGYSFVRMSGVEIGGGSRRQLVLVGDKKTLEIRPLEQGLTEEEKETYGPAKYAMTVERTERTLNELGRSVKKHEKSEIFCRYDDMMQAFAAMVRGEKEKPYTLEYELLLYRTLLQCCGK
ncbi:MAG: Gfo/Idh/MocA family oxidoreductase [Clostridia bacterium]|nr:Gfo/Idh/MocA family oxidoreductase [Clostridia bacterium]